MASLRQRSGSWYIRYRTPEGKCTEVKAGKDKQVAKQLARDLENKLRRIKLGLLGPREAAHLEAERVHIRDHVQDYVRYIEASGAVPEHVEGVRKRLEWFLETTQVVLLSQLKPSVATTALKALRNAGKADRTISHYCQTFKSFSRWLKRDRRTDSDLLEDLERPAVVTEAKRVALTPDQLGRLIAVTRSSGPRRKLPGLDRSWLYHLAAVTGLRRAELESLTPQSFDLNADPPTVHVGAQHTKSGKAGTQPLPEHIIPDLRVSLASKAAHTPLFPANRNSAVMIRADLKAAGIPPAEFCFHSLRHTYATLIDGCGASTKEAMELARHADASLTLNRYTLTHDCKI